VPQEKRRATFSPASGALAGDLIGITGVPGRAQAALGGDHRFDAALFTPVPGVHEGISLANAGVSAMMDVSDGLALSLYDLSAVNNLCFSVESGKIPAPDGLSAREAREYSLFGGGDYGLLFTIPPARLPVHGVRYTIIGEVKEGSGVLIDGETLSRRGFLHSW